MDFDRVASVLEIVLGAVGRRWKLAGLANWNEADTQLVSQSRAEHEAPGLDADDRADRVPIEPLSHELNARPERFDVRE